VGLPGGFCLATKRAIFQRLLLFPTEEKLELLEMKRFKRRLFLINLWPSASLASPDWILPRCGEIRQFFPRLQISKHCTCCKRFALDDCVADKIVSSMYPADHNSSPSLGGGPGRDSGMKVVWNTSTIKSGQKEKLIPGRLELRKD